MGTPDFSVPTLEKLYNDKNIDIKYVVTKADSKSSREQKNVCDFTFDEQELYKGVIYSEILKRKYN